MEFRTNISIVSLNDKGLPDAKERPVVGDMYLTPSRTDPEMYDEWIWSGGTSEWQKAGSLPSFDDERTMRQQRVENIKSYFKKKKEQYIKTMSFRHTDELDEAGTGFREIKDEQG